MKLSCFFLLFVFPFNAHMPSFFSVLFGSRVKRNGSVPLLTSHHITSHYKQCASLQLDNKSVIMTTVRVSDDEDEKVIINRYKIEWEWGSFLSVKDGKMGKQRRRRSALAFLSLCFGVELSWKNKILQVEWCWVVMIMVALASNATAPLKRNLLSGGPSRHGRLKTVASEWGTQEEAYIIFLRFPLVSCFFSPLFQSVRVITVLYVLSLLLTVSSSFLMIWFDMIWYGNFGVVPFLPHAFLSWIGLFPRSGKKRMWVWYQAEKLPVFVLVWWGYETLITPFWNYKPENYMGKKGMELGWWNEVPFQPKYVHFTYTFHFQY